MTEYRFVPQYDVDAASEEEAFRVFVEAMETDLAHWRTHGFTQIEWKTETTEATQLAAFAPMGTLVTIKGEEQRTYEVVGYWRGYLRLRNVSMGTEAHYLPEDIAWMNHG